MFSCYTSLFLFVFCFINSILEMSVLSSYDCLGSDEIVTYDILNYIARMQKHPFCPGHLRKWDVHGCVAADVSFDIAKRHVDNYLARQARIIPLRDTLDVALVETSVTLNPTGVVTMTEEKSSLALPLQCGYFVSEDRVHDVKKSWLADAVAYQMMGTSESDGLSKCRVTSLDESELNLASQAFEVDLPVAFTNVPTDNAATLFSLFETDVGDAVVDTMICQMNNIDIPSENPVRQSLQLVQGENEFYNLYDKHRRMRDVDFRSKLTSGYYFGSMSPGLERVVSLLVDILDYSYRVRENRIIFHFGEVNTALYALLSANGMNVFVIGGNLFDSHYTTLNSVDWSYDPRCRGAILYLSEAFDNSTPVHPKGKATVNHGHSSLLRGMSRRGFNKKFLKYIGGQWKLKLTHVYLRDYMEHVINYILPSTDAHRGIVMICTTPITNPRWTVKSLFWRANVANKYRTAFPIHRATFGAQDPYAPLSWKFGVQLVCGVIDRRKSTQKCFDGKFDRDKEIEMCRRRSNWFLLGGKICESGIG